MSQRQGLHHGFTDSERRVMDKYIARYAEPEVAYAEQIPGAYRAAVVVPLCAEEPNVVERLSAALAEARAQQRAGATNPSLLIAVVNGRRDAEEVVHTANRVLLESWRARALRRRVLVSVGPAVGREAAAAELLEIGGGQGGALHVLLLDCATGARGFPAKQGVGLARRIGCDLAVALARRGSVAARYIGSTDGDVQLPMGYLSRLEGRPQATARLFPFEHVGDDEQVLLATELVELSWRYYVLGLAWAGSPFAYHSVGSCMAVEVVAYARARGFPRREAAEDFHLLAKLAKLGTLDVLSGPVLHIEARRSRRVPFGTGPAVERVLSERETAGGGTSLVDGFRLHDPRVFVALRALLDALRGLAGSPGSSSSVVSLPEPVRNLWSAYEQQWRTTLVPRLADCPSPAHRLHRIYEAFDALATLRAVHGFRDAGLPPVPWFWAVAEAPFFENLPRPDPRQALALAKGLESSLPTTRGLAPPGLFMNT